MLYWHVIKRFPAWFCQVLPKLANKTHHAADRAVVLLLGMLCLLFGWEGVCLIFVSNTPTPTFGNTYGSYEHLLSEVKIKGTLFTFTCQK